MNYAFRSQWDADANQKREDCGPACVASVLDAFGKHVAINDISALIMPGQDVGTDAASLAVALNHYGVAPQLWIGTSYPAPPYIALVHYAGFDRANVQDAAFMGWHWLLVLSLNDLTAVVHDPDYWGARRNEGSLKRYSRAEFDRAFIPYGATKIAVKWQEVQPVANTQYEIHDPSGAVIGSLSIAGSVVPSGAPTPPADLWTESYYLGTAWAGAVVYKATSPGPALEHNWGAGSPNVAVPVDNFSAIFECDHVFAAGTYQVKVRSDDGFEYSVDGVVPAGLSGLIVQSAGSKEYVGQFTVTAGVHHLKVKYTEFAGDAEIHVSAPTPF